MPAVDPPEQEESSRARGDDGPGKRRESSRGRIGRNVAFFSFATGLSRVLGLAREVVAASYFGVSGAMSAFTIAFQVPNLVRALFADAALQGAFVPVFSELLEKGKRKEAFKVASGLLSLLTLVLGALTLVFLLAAPWIMKLVTPGFDGSSKPAEMRLHRRGVAPVLQALSLRPVDPLFL